MKKRQLILNDYRTAEDGLFTLSACKITKAAQEQTFVKVPGRFAPLDLSTVLTDGQPYYGNASLDAVLESSEGTREERQQRIDHLKNLLDGQIAKIIHPDFPGRYLVGRVEVVPDFNGLAYCSVALSAVLEPWLYNAEETEVVSSLPHYEPYENLISYPYDETTKTENGMTFTDNGDGSVTLNGTATSQTNFYLEKYFSLPAGDYYVSGIPQDTNAKCIIYISDTSGTKIARTDGTDSESAFTIAQATTVHIRIIAYNGFTCSDFVVKPMLNEGDTAAPFKPAQNLIPFPYTDTTKTENGITFTVNADNSITIKGTSTALATFYLWRDPNLKAGATYCYSGVRFGGISAYVYYVDKDGKGHWDSNMTSFVMEEGMTVKTVYVQVPSGKTVDTTLYPMLIEGTAAAPYVPYVNAGGKNVIPFPYTETSKTMNGITFTVNADGSILVDGTATAFTSFELYRTADFNITKGALSGVPSGYGVNLALRLRDSEAGVDIGRDQGNGLIFETSAKVVNLYLLVQSGTTIKKALVKPVLERGDRIKPLGKNLIPYPYYETTKTINGISFTSKEDGGIHISGTSTATTSFYLVSDGTTLRKPIDAGQYTASINAVPGVELIVGVTGVGEFQNSFKVPENNTYYARLRVGAGVSFDTTLYPMLNEGETALPYESFEGFEPWYPLGDQLLTLTNEGKLAVVPVVEVKGEVALTLGNTSRAMSTGSYLLPELYLTPGEHKVQCSGNGTATITYREAVLAG